MPNHFSRPKRDCRRRPPYQDGFPAESSSANLILNHQPPFAQALANVNCPHPYLSHYVTHPTGVRP